MHFSAVGIDSPLFNPKTIRSFNLVSSTTLLGALYGIAFTLYCLCLRLLYRELQGPVKRKQTIFTSTYISLILFCDTLYLVLYAWLSRLEFVNHASFPGGPGGYGASGHGFRTHPASTLVGVLSLAVQALTMGMQIWRLWVVWSGTQYVITATILPTLLLCAYIALSIPTNILSALVPLDRLNIPPASLFAINVASYLVLSLFTILATGLVITRILLVRRRHVKLLGTSDTSSHYLSIMTMLIESYAVETIWSIASAISRAFYSPSSNIFTRSDSTIKTIASFLIVYRVSMGRGWTSQTERELTSLRCNHDETVTDEVPDIYSLGTATPAVAFASPSMDV